MIPSSSHPSGGSAPVNAGPRILNSSQQWVISLFLPTFSQPSEATRTNSFQAFIPFQPIKWAHLRRILFQPILRTSVPTVSTSYDPTAPENLQLVLYRGPKDTTPPVKPFKLPSFPDLKPYIKETFKQRNIMFFGLGATSSGFMVTAITTSTPVVILALIIGGIAFSIIRYKVEEGQDQHQYQKLIDQDKKIFRFKPVKITTREEALEYLAFPQDTTNQAWIKRMVDLRLKACNKYLERRNQLISPGPVLPLYKLVQTMAERTNTAYNLLKD